MIIDILTIGLFIVLFGLIACFLYAQTVNRRLSKALILLKELHELHQEQADELTTLKSTTTSLEQYKSLQDKQQKSLKELDELKHLVAKFDHKIEQLEHSDPVLKMYKRANELVAQGASAEEIMDACELPKAEVDVLMGLHRR